MGKVEKKTTTVRGVVSLVTSNELAGARGRGCGTIFFFLINRTSVDTAVGKVTNSIRRFEIKEYVQGWSG